MAIRWGAVLRILIFGAIASILFPNLPGFVWFVYGFFDPPIEFGTKPKGKHAK